MSWGRVLLFSFVLANLIPVISNKAPTRAKRCTELKGDPKGSFVRGFYIRGRRRLQKAEKLSKVTRVEGEEFNLKHINANQLTMFYDRFHGNVRHKGHLQVLLINDKEHCKVEFRNTPYTTENNNLLSTLIMKLRFSSTSTNAQVSQLVIDWKK